MQSSCLHSLFFHEVFGCLFFHLATWKVHQKSQKEKVQEILCGLCHTSEAPNPRLIWVKHGLSVWLSESCFITSSNESWTSENRRGRGETHSICLAQKNLSKLKMNKSCLILSNYFLIPDAVRGKSELHHAEGSVSLEVKTDSLGLSWLQYLTYKKKKIKYYEIFQLQKQLNCSSRCTRMR